MEKEIGKVVDYFAKIGVVAIELDDELCVGDTIHIVGHTTELVQKISSMQIEHSSVTVAGRGDSIGIKVSERVRTHDKVYKVME